MTLSRYSRSFTLALKRVGREVTVIRSTSSSTNDYGKNDDTEWDNPETVGTWRAFRSYNYRSDRPEQAFTGAGERDEETPTILISKSADVQNGDRLQYDGVTYEVTSDPVSYDTHYEVQTTKVDQS